MREQPLILITNDDGVSSPGLMAAAEAVLDLGEVLIVAPLHQQTGMSRSYPKGPSAGKIERLQLPVGGASLTAYGVHGSPAQAVSHAILEIASRTPAVCISGINYGENFGLTLSGSGTIGAAIEAFSYDVPGLAANLEASVDVQHSSDFGSMEWGPAQHFTRVLTESILRDGLPGDVAVLNLNVPSSAIDGTPMRATAQSRQNYFVFADPGARDFNEPFRFKTIVEYDENALEQDSDVYAVVVDRVVSVTPLSWSMTARAKWDPPR